jgi:hypothetical protein
MTDTSGAGILEAKGLQEQILSDQEAYQDNLVDRELQKLSEANEAAAEQREK